MCLGRKPMRKLLPFHFHTCVFAVAGGPDGSLTHIGEASLLHNLVYGRLQLPRAAQSVEADLCHRLVPESGDIFDLHLKPLTAF